MLVPEARSNVFVAMQRESESYWLNLQEACGYGFRSSHHVIAAPREATQTDSGPAHAAAQWLLLADASGR